VHVISSNFSEFVFSDELGLIEILFKVRYKVPGILVSKFIGINCEHS